MVVSRQSRLVRWAYFLDSRTPEHTSLCALFWRTVLITPLKICMIIGGAISITFLLAMLGYEGFLNAALVGKVAVVTLPVVGICYWLFKPRGHLDAPAKRAIEAITESVVVQGAIAVKSKICPLIELRQ